MEKIIEWLTIMGEDFIMEMIALTAMACISLCLCVLPIFIAMEVDASRKTQERTKPFIVAEDKVEEFLKEKSDKEAIDKIYEMADKFEKICKKNELGE